MAEPLVEEPAVSNVEQHAIALVDEARAIVIANDAQLQDASRFLRERCKAVQQEISETFDPIVSKAHSAHKEAVAQRDRHLRPVLEAERVVKAAIAAYSREQQDRQRRELLERQREAQVLAERERLERAVTLENQGRQPEALALLDKPMPTAVVAVPRAVPKMEGTSISTLWSALVVDLAALIQAAAADPQYQNLLLPNQVALNALARAQKDNLRVAGVLAVTADSVRSRA